MSLTTRAAACASKIHYSTEREAKHALKQVDKGHHSSARLAAYHCPLGDHWHLGHVKSKKELRSRRAAARAR